MSFLSLHVLKGSAISILLMLFLGGGLFGQSDEKVAQEKKEDSLERVMYAARENGNMEKYHRIREQLQETAPPPSPVSKAEQKEDSLEKRMYAARENGNMEKYQRIREELQEMEPPPSPVSKDEKREKELEEAMYAARENGNEAKYQRLKEKLQELGREAEKKTNGSMDGD